MKSVPFLSTASPLGNKKNLNEPRQIGQLHDVSLTLYIALVVISIAIANDDLKSTITCSHVAKYSHISKLGLVSYKVFNT